jgi:hypothetical protein
MIVLRKTASYRNFSLYWENTVIIFLINDLNETHGFNKSIQPDPYLGMTGLNAGL